jgi:adenylate kinase
MKQVILIVGTPCVGKTTLAKQLVKRIEAFYINLTENKKKNCLTLRKDLQRNSVIVDEAKMLSALADTIAQLNCSIVVDGHFAASVVPRGLSTWVFVLRRNPVELKEYMQKEGFSEAKIYENLSAEILDVCLIETLEMQTSRVCEIDVTGKSVEQTVDEVLSILWEQREGSYGGVDWIEFLEREGLTDQYLKDY